MIRNKGQNRSRIERHYVYIIPSKNAYGFDETGLLMAVATNNVITAPESPLCPVVVQPDNREWVRAIKYISVAGWALLLGLLRKISLTGMV